MIDKINIQSDAQLLHGKRLAAAVRAGAEGASGTRASHGPLAELCASLLSEELETLESAADCAAAKMPREPRVRHEIRTNWHPDLASMACESPAPHKSLFISHSRSRCAALSSPGCRNAIQSCRPQGHDAPCAISKRVVHPPAKGIRTSGRECAANGPEVPWERNTCSTQTTRVHLSRCQARCILHCRNPGVQVCGHPFRRRRQQLKSPARRTVFLQSTPVQ